MQTRTFLPILIALGGALPYYAFLGFCAWKFYQLFSSLNSNIDGIRRVLERNDGKEPIT